jgi:hypothetical protein
MPASGSLESLIDAIYQARLPDFISQRDTLAASLTGADRRRVKSLSKPTTLPWVINHVYWGARPAYDRLLTAGKDLRAAQVASLKGRATDVRDATLRHRGALQKAVDAATRIAAGAGVDVPRDELHRMLEAVSMSETLPEPHGRFTKPLKPAGFEALSGLAIASTPVAAISFDRAGRERERQRREREALKADQQREAAVRKAEQEVARATALEKRTRQAWERAKVQLDRAERELAAARQPK